MKPHELVTRPITEAEFSSFVEAALRQFGWRFCHYRTSIDPRRKGAWRTALTGDKGFPDYVAVRVPRLLFVELKSDKGILSPDQCEWLKAFRECKEGGGMSRVEVHVWRPKDQEVVLAVLR